MSTTLTTQNESEGVLILNEKGLIILINPSANNLFGYTENELLNQSIEHIILNGDSVIQQNTLHPSKNKLLVGKKSKLSGIKNDGGQFEVDISTSPFEGGKEIFTVIFVSDARKQPNAESQELTPVILLILDTALNISLINTYGSTLLGSAEETLRGLNWFENFLPLDYTDQVQTIFNKAVITGAIENYETPVLTLKGERYTIRWTTRVIYDSSGTAVATLSTGVDSGKKLDEEIDLHHLQRIKKSKEKIESRVNEQNSNLLDSLGIIKKINHDLELQIQKRIVIEEKLLKIQRLYDRVVHHFPDGIIGVINRDMKYVLLDGKEMNAINLPSIGINKHGSDKLNSVAIDDGTLEKLMKVFNGESVSFEIKTNNQVYSIAGEPLPDGKDAINEILCVLTNVTERRLMEESLLLALDKERELGELKSRFITLASHEFKTPLSTILSSVFFLENYTGEDYDKEKAVHTNRIKRSVNTINGTLNEFLLLDKHQENEVKIVSSEINIPNFAKELISEIGSSRKKNQVITYHHSGAIDTCTIDTHLLWSILTNLISNSLKYSKEGSEILVHSVVDNNVLKLVVKDHGIGIPEKEQKSVFELFFRAENAMNFKGTGLGLHIVGKNVKLLGGTIEFKSRENVGSEFTVVIPIQNAIETEINNTNLVKL
jgi:PAS domain S-box-containing protein